MMKNLIAAILLCWSSAAFAQGSETFGTYVNGNTAGTLPLTGSEQTYVRQGGNSRTVPTSAFGPILIGGNVDVYANPSTGLDTNNCLFSSGTAPNGPCKTFQQAVYVATQTMRYGIGIGYGKIHLADGTYPEQVLFPSLLGIPGTDGSGDASLEVDGNFSTPGNVVISPANGVCNRGETQWGHLGHAALQFDQPGRFTLHGITVTTVNEATNQCSDIETTFGAYVFLAGTNNLNATHTTANGSGQILVFQGGWVGFENQTLNITGGTTSAWFFVVANGGSIVADSATLNFVGTNSFYQFVAAIDGQGEAYGFQGGITITGTVSGLCWGNDNGIVQGGPFTGAIPATTWPGCTQPYGNLQQGASYYGTSFGSAIGTDNEGAPPTISSCGSGASLDAYASDSDATITEGSAATGCVFTFNTPWPFVPNCSVTADNSSLGLSYVRTASTVTITNIGALSGHKLTVLCVHHR